LQRRWKGATEPGIGEVGRVGAGGETALLFHKGKEKGPQKRRPPGSIKIKRDRAKGERIKLIDIRKAC